MSILCIVWNIPFTQLASTTRFIAVPIQKNIAITLLQQPTKPALHEQYAH